MAFCKLKQWLVTVRYHERALFLLDRGEGQIEMEQSESV
jgi:hypothetical protein